MYTGVNDCSLIERGPDTDLSNAELEVLIRGMTGESYVPELLVPPEKAKPLCVDQGIRTAILATLPTLDDGALAVRQLGGDPNLGIWIPGVDPDAAPRAEPRSSRSGDQAPGSSGKGKATKVGSSRSSRDHGDDRP